MTIPTTKPTRHIARLLAASANQDPLAIRQALDDAREEGWTSDLLLISVLGGYELLLAEKGIDVAHDSSAILVQMAGEEPSVW